MGEILQKMLQNMDFSKITGEEIIRILDETSLDDEEIFLLVSKANDAGILDEDNLINILEYYVSSYDMFREIIQSPKYSYSQEQFSNLEYLLYDTDFISEVAKQHSVCTYEDRENFLHKDKLSWKEFYENYDNWDTEIQYINFRKITDMDKAKGSEFTDFLMYCDINEEMKKVAISGRIKLSKKNILEALDTGYFEDDEAVKLINNQRRVQGLELSTSFLTSLEDHFIDIDELGSDVEELYDQFANESEITFDDFDAYHDGWNEEILNNNFMKLRSLKGATSSDLTSLITDYDLNDECLNHLSQMAKEDFIDFEPDEVIELLDFLDYDQMNLILTNNKQVFSEKELTELEDYGIDEKILEGMASRSGLLTSWQKDEIEFKKEMEELEKEAELMNKRSSIPFFGALFRKNTGRKFKVGDRVRVIYRGEEGRVIDYNGDYVMVRLSNGRADSYKEEDLERAW